MQLEIEETSYAYRERLRFLCERINPDRNLNILDIGCGTGKLLSAHLIERYPNSRFLLVENDRPSLLEARNHLANFKNCELHEQIPADAEFDVAIASEVIEHVFSPREFLRSIHRQLKPGGKILLTVPNGYGPSEAMASAEFLIKIVKRTLLSGDAKRAQSGQDTLAYSPHVQFFSLGALTKTLRAEGFRIVAIQGRMFACGFPISILIDKSKLLQALNVRLGRSLPLWMVSDWMIEARREDICSAEPEQQPNIYTKLKRKISMHKALMPKHNDESPVEHFSRTSESFRDSYHLDEDFRERLSVWTSLIKKFTKGSTTAIDLGCGPGMITKALLDAGLQVTASDGAPEMLALCQTKNPGAKLTTVQSLLPEIPELLGRRADLLLSSSVLEYVPRLPLAIENMARLLNAGGIAIISFPNRQSLYRKMEAWRYRLTGRPEYFKHVKNQLTAEEMKSLFAQFGLQMLEHHFYGDGGKLQKKALGPLPAAWKKNLVVGVFQKI